MKKIMQIKSPLRRAFLGSAGLTTGAAVSLGFAPKASAMNQTKTMVYLFLRGGSDGLNLIPPRSGANFNNYQSLRPNINLDTGESMTLANVNGTNPGQAFGIHPEAAPIRDLFNQGQVAIIQACGHKDEEDRTRSHFDAQEQIELGTPGSQLSNSGWLSRFLETTSAVPGSIFSALASSSNPPESLRGWPDVATIDSTGSFHPDDHDRRFRDTHIEALRAIYSAGTGSFDQAGMAALDAVDLIADVQQDLENYTPSPGVTYPNTGLGRDLELIAQMVVQDLGISAATVNIGGWDTHSQQDGAFNNRVSELADAVAAFHRDIQGKGLGDDVALVIQSEFGRQVRENANRGTDHGHGNVMMVLSGGGGFDGGLYGDFPGLSNANLASGDSLNPTTDFRDVLAGVTQGLLGNNNTDFIFNSENDGYVYAPPSSWFV